MHQRGSRDQFVLCKRVEVVSGEGLVVTAVVVELVKSTFAWPRQFVSV